MTKWDAQNIAVAHTQREMDDVPQRVTPAQAAQWMNEAIDEETEALRARIEHLERELARTRKDRDDIAIYASKLEQKLLSLTEAANRAMTEAVADEMDGWDAQIKAEVEGESE